METSEYYAILNAHRRRVMLDGAGDDAPEMTNTEKLYNYFSVSVNDYPYLLIECGNSSGYSPDILIRFAKQLTIYPKSYSINNYYEQRINNVKVTSKNELLGKVLSTPPNLTNNPRSAATCPTWLTRLTYAAITNIIPLVTPFESID